MFIFIIEKLCVGIFVKSFSVFIINVDEDVDFFNIIGNINSSE